MNPSDYLKDVPQENNFRLVDGRVLRNLEELYSIVEDSGDDIFYYHVTTDRNDFASWITDCIRYQELYNKLLPIKDRQSFLKVLDQEIESLKNPKISETMKFFSEDYDPKKETQQADYSRASSQSSQQTATQPNSLSSSQPTNIVFPSPVSSDASPDSSSDLDFEQILGSIVQEIQEEIFFWQ